MKWISFDCFGTLVDWNAGFAAILAAAGVEQPRNIVACYHEFEPVVEAEPFRSYRDVTRIALERAAEAAGRDLSEEQTRALAERWPELPVFSDTVPALQRLREDGWNLAVLTNCDDDLFARTQARIGVNFDAVVTAQRVRSYKPALAHFTYFRDNVLAPGDDWVHAANSWVHDIEPARRLGIPRIWVDRDRSGHDPSAAGTQVHDLTKLPDIVTGVCHPAAQK